MQMAVHWGRRRGGASSCGQVVLGCIGKLTENGLARYQQPAFSHGVCFKFLPAFLPWPPSIMDPGTVSQINPFQPVLLLVTMLVKQQKGSYNTHLLWKMAAPQVKVLHYAVSPRLLWCLTSSPGIQWCHEQSAVHTALFVLLVTHAALWHLTSLVLLFIRQFNWNRHKAWLHFCSAW